jgi:hypothetical protein
MPSRQNRCDSSSADPVKFEKLSLASQGYDASAANYDPTSA